MNDAAACPRRQLWSNRHFNEQDVGRLSHDMAPALSASPLLHETRSGSTLCWASRWHSRRFRCFSGSKRIGLGVGHQAGNRRAVLGMMASSMFTFIVFVCSALLIAVQLASAQLTPRIIAIVFRDPVTKCLIDDVRIHVHFLAGGSGADQSEVPMLTARLSAYSCIACLGVFLFLIDHVGKWLRPAAPCERPPCWAARSSRRSTRGDWRNARRQPQEPAAVLGGEPAWTVPSLRNGVMLGLRRPRACLHGPACRLYY